MTTGDALLAAVRAAPDDDGPRLAYADHVREEGNERLADFIETRLEASLNPVLEADRHGNAGVRPFSEIQEAETLRDRVRTLWGSWPETDDPRSHFHHQFSNDVTPTTPDGHDGSLGWLILPQELAWDGMGRLSATVRRGLVESVRLSGDDWVEYGDALLARHPITRVQILAPFNWVCITGDAVTGWNYGLAEHTGTRADLVTVNSPHEEMVASRDRRGVVWNTPAALRWFRTIWPSVPEGGWDLQYRRIPRASDQQIGAV